MLKLPSVILNLFFFNSTIVSCILKVYYSVHKDFPESSVGKESAYIAGDPGSIPGSRRSTGQRIGYPHQYSWSSLVPQLVKNPSAMRETWVWSLGGEDPLEKAKSTHSSILAWKIPWTVHHVVACKELDTTEQLTFTFSFSIYIFMIIMCSWWTDTFFIPKLFIFGNTPHFDVYFIK